ncbi:hypothetical protein KJ765_05565 [Candidatus Micrarchaeota archaeon]|nr:hypothetical protein [Candidatus Micrarchaeota archaeon]
MDSTGFEFSAHPLGTGNMWECSLTGIGESIQAPKLSIVEHPSGRQWSAELTIRGYWKTPEMMRGEYMTYTLDLLSKNARMDGKLSRSEQEDLRKELNTFLRQKFAFFEFPSRNNAETLSSKRMQDALLKAFSTPSPEVPKAPHQGSE